jgi:TetR/AcrR family transcriptional regulator, tetracycline repressor protein
VAQRMTDRGPLSRDEILEAALTLAEQDGIDALSMHRVAAAVGVRTMSLYNHVRDKNALLDGMADRILAGIVLPEAPADHWESDLARLAAAFRTAAMAYPHTAPLLLTRRLNTPALLPAVEKALSALRRGGFSPAAAVHALRALIAFLIGTLLREAGSAPSFSGAIPELVTTRASELQESGFPEVARAADELSLIDHAEEFEYGLRLFLASLRGQAEPATLSTDPRKV